MANQNGNAALYNANGNAVLSSPGYHSDMQIMMEHMERLSNTLARNRQEWGVVQDGLARVERLQGRMARDGQLPLVNGDAASHDDASPTVLQLQNSLASAENQIATLKSSFNDLQTLLSTYQDSLNQTTQLAEQYSSTQKAYLSNIHQHYSQQLLESRQETIAAQLTHQEWQARLSVLEATLKKAYEAREKEGEPYRRRLAALKEENRILRLKVGWDPPVDSEDEAAEDDERLSMVLGGPGG